MKYFTRFPRGMNPLIDISFELYIDFKKIPTNAFLTLILRTV